MPSISWGVLEGEVVVIFRTITASQRAPYTQNTKIEQRPFLCLVNGGKVANEKVG